MDDGKEMSTNFTSVENENDSEPTCNSYTVKQPASLENGKQGERIIQHNATGIQETDSDAPVLPFVVHSPQLLTHAEIHQQCQLKN